jgi:hypothetical protein
MAAARRLISGVFVASDLLPFPTWLGAPEELRDLPAGELPDGFRRVDLTKVFYLRGPPGQYKGAI